MNNQPINNRKNSNTRLQNGNNLNTHVERVTPDAVSYKDGYVHGRTVERRAELERQQIRDENTAARALFLGIGLTALLAAAIGSIFYFNQRQETVEPVFVPVPSTREQPKQETKIIERTTETIQPQPSVSNDTPPVVTPQQSQPDIEVIVPQSEPQQQVPIQESTNSPAPLTQPQNQAVPNSSLSNPTNIPTTTTQPSPNNQSSSTAPQTQIPTIRATTESPNTTNPNSSNQIQNSTESDNSTSAEGQTN